TARAADVTTAPATTPRGVLAALDAIRAAAYARRDPTLLDTVYASATLLARDRAQLLAIVPSGCGLHGVRTTFTPVSVAHRSPTAMTVRARMAITPSRLVCDGTVSGTAPGSRGAVVLLRLVRQGTGYRIAGQRRT